MKGIVELFIEDRMWPDIYTWKPKTDKKQGDWDRFSTFFYDSDALILLRRRHLISTTIHNVTCEKHNLNVNILSSSLSVIAKISFYSSPIKTFYLKNSFE